MSGPTALADLVQLYLHQDWVLEYADVWAAVDAFIAGEDPRLTAELLAEVSALLATEPDEETVQRLLVEDLGSEYWPPGDGMTFLEWLQRLEGRLRDTTV